MGKNKSKIVINLEYIAAKIGIGLARLLPLRIAYGLVDLFCRVFFICDSKHRKRSIKHIMFAGIADDYNRAREIALASFIHLGKVGVEFIKLQKLFTSKSIGKYVKYNISEEARQALMDPRGTVCASAHYGNWEITGLSLSLLFRDIVSVGRTFDNPKISEYIFRKRQSFKQEIYTQRGVLKQLLLGLKHQKLLGILIDQYPGDDRGVETLFFSRPVRTHDTPSLLHLKTGAPLLLIVTRRLDDNFHFELIVRGPFTVPASGDTVQDVKRLTQMINDELEQIIKEVPEQWLWAHRRWRDVDNEDIK